MFFCMGLLIFFILIVIAVILHEFGHFLAARKLGVIAEEFNIGMGQRLPGRESERLVGISEFSHLVEAAC